MRLENYAQARGWVNTRTRQKESVCVGVATCSQQIVLPQLELSTMQSCCYCGLKNAALIEFYLHAVFLQSDAVAKEMSRVPNQSHTASTIATLISFFNSHINEIFASFFEVPTTTPPLTLQRIFLRTPNISRVGYTRPTAAIPLIRSQVTGSDGSAAMALPRRSFHPEQDDALPAAIGERDEAVVQSTANDATVCKLAAASRGYFEDPFLQYFVKTPMRKPPIISRGEAERDVFVR